jgi:hypothetical protein
VAVGTTDAGEQDAAREIGAPLVDSFDDVGQEDEAELGGMSSGHGGGQNGREMWRPESMVWAPWFSRERRGNRG